MTLHEAEIQIALLVVSQKSLVSQIEDIEDRSDKKIAVVEGELAALRLERDKALKWGVITLGSAVISLVIWIANKIMGGHIQ
jgi:hypothetical protein